MVLRMIDAYCPPCGDPTVHSVMRLDPGSATCVGCGAQQPLVVPIEG